MTFGGNLFGGNFATSLQTLRFTFVVEIKNSSTMAKHNHRNGATHHHHLPEGSMSSLVLCLTINLIFVVVETLVGVWSNSTGLLSDAGHNLSDVLGLLLSMIALRLASHKGGERVSLFVTLANSLLLLGAVVMITVESVDKILHPAQLNAEAMIGVALVGIVVNGFTAWLLMRGGGENVNIRAAFLHAATDALVSVGVVVSGVVIALTGVIIIDPLVSLLLSFVVALPALKLMLHTLKAIKKY